jgi:uncharacterized membrane protein YhaH (DUF805 family)
MNFAEAIQSGLKNYVNFDGRSSRSEYNYWTLFVMLLSILATILDPPDFYSGKGSTLSNIVALALFLPGIAVGIRRFHDINKSGWNWLWMLTIIGIFPVIYWIVFKPGDSQNNSYGSNPLITEQVPSDNSKAENKSVPDESNVEEELTKLKKMLDDGLIEQEDYDVKKKELLGI